MHMIWLLVMAIELKACMYRYLHIFILICFVYPQTYKNFQIINPVVAITNTINTISLSCWLDEGD